MQPHWWITNHSLVDADRLMEKGEPVVGGLGDSETSLTATGTPACPATISKPSRTKSSQVKPKMQKAGKDGEELLEVYAVFTCKAKEASESISESTRFFVLVDQAVTASFLHCIQFLVFVVIQSHRPNSCAFPVCGKRHLLTQQ